VQWLCSLLQQFGGLGGVTDRQRLRVAWGRTLQGFLNGGMNIRLALKMDPRQSIETAEVESRPGKFVAWENEFLWQGKNPDFSVFEPWPI
jgi:hypothetical protein